ncbi:MAG TPA: DUF192 domain-containing protein [Candidatus Paceibacterota bacterium]|jgi:uncharacterized membrane protein (UPF0127 family)|nr:DUF192 domain-containing protein [Candidatus Paceibacterota bacterium]
MSKGLMNTIFIIMGLIVLYFIARELFAEHKVPTLGELTASSTLNAEGSSTSRIKDADTETYSTTSPKVSALAKLFQSIASSTTVTNKNTDASKTANGLIDLPSTTLFGSKGSVKVLVANTDASREQGLSGQTSLPNGAGMLFVFDTPGKYGFWMKDMNFPLDLIWIDANNKIVGVTKNALPSSYPFVFMPPKDIVYVLEMNTGSVAQFGLTTGTAVKFSLPK